MLTTKRPPAGGAEGGPPPGRHVRGSCDAACLYVFGLATGRRGRESGRLMQAHHQERAVQRSRTREGLDHPLHVQCLQGHPMQRGTYQKRCPRGSGRGAGHLAGDRGGRAPRARHTCRDEAASPLSRGHLPALLRGYEHQGNHRPDRCERMRGGQKAEPRPHRASVQAGGRER